MSAIRADFLMVRTDDIYRCKKLGHHPTPLVAAFVLAAVRYATQLPTGTGRLVLEDGRVWWRVSQSDLAISIGVHDPKERYRIMRTVNKLMSAGWLLVCWPGASGDRTKAYRLPDENAADQSLCTSEDAVTSHCATRTDQCALPTDPMCTSAIPTMSLENWREGGEARARAGKRTAQPDSRSQALPTPPQNQPQNNDDDSPFCPRHQPHGTDESCWQCRDARKRYEAMRPDPKDVPVITDEHRRIGDLKRNCPTCEGYSIGDGTGIRPCRPDNPIPGCPVFEAAS